MIRLERISRVFELGGQPVRALDDLSLHVAAGEYLSVMGPSGSGKSTLLNVVGCLDRPTSGRYLLRGRDVGLLDDAALSTIRGHEIGFVFQSFHLVPRLSALENVELPMVFAGVPRPERLERSRAALASVGLAPRAAHRPEQLSGGERQRAALARAVVMGPSILLADEPTGNLDTASGRDVIELLERMNGEGLTLVVVTHDPAIGRRARRQVRLVDGRIASDVPRDAAPRLVLAEPA